MKQGQLSPSYRAKSISLQLLDELLSAEATQEVAFRLWDGTLWPDDQPRPATIVLNHPGALRTMFASMNEVGLAEAYLYDDFDVEGDIESVYGLADGLIKASSSLSTKVRRPEDHHQRALEFVSEPTYRVWRLFMFASAYGFSSGTINVYQSLLVKQKGDGASSLPLTRADWYV